MAKQRQPAKPSKSIGRSTAAQPRRAGEAAPPAPSGPLATPGTPVRRATYVEAVALYERGLEALQRHEYESAQHTFESVLRLYAEEKELHERVRLYLSICQRQTATRAATPQTIEERLYAATLAINGGNYELAFQHLRLVRDEDPDNDHALYMLAVAHALRGEHAEAIAHLERSIALNPENRALARAEADFEPLHDDDTFRAVLDASSSQAPLTRRPLRTKSAR